MEDAQKTAGEGSASSKRKFERICVFCGSRPGNKPSFSHATLELGKILVTNSNLRFYLKMRNSLKTTCEDKVLLSLAPIIP